MTVHFTPAVRGGWIALTSGETLLVIGAPADQATVDALWDALIASGGFQRVLDVLTNKGLAATPPFALFDGSALCLRIIVRGPVTATVADAKGTHRLDGSGVTTWLEQTLTEVSSAIVDVTAAVAAEGVVQLPLGIGAAWVSALELRFVTSAATMSKPAQPVVASPASAPESALEIDPEATVTEAPTERIDAPEAKSDTPADGYDYLFGATMFRDVAGAAVLEALVEEEAPVEGEVPVEEEVPADRAGDHDGYTVLTSDIAKLRAERAAKRNVSTPPEPAAPVTEVFLVLSGGSREPLTQPILVGRSPSVSQVSGGQMPRLLTVGTPDQDISRTHVRFVLEGGTVVVTDLHSRNGTLVVLPGKEPQKLRAGEPTSVIAGTVVDLGGGITLTVEEAVGEA